VVNNPPSEAEPSVRLVPPFACDLSYVDDRAVLTVHGEIDIATVPIILKHVRATMATPSGGIAIDLGDVTFMDSSGADALETMRDEAAAQEVPFILAAIASPARFVLDLLGLAATFGLRPRASDARGRDGKSEFTTQSVDEAVLATLRGADPDEFATR
jgi:anti-sigma B factor antagonist